MLFTLARDRRGLMLEQRSFPFQAPPVACQLPIFADHAMARHYHGHWIGGASSSHSPHGVRPPDPACNLRVGSRGSIGNAPQFLPNPSLESGCLHVGRQIKTWFPAPQVRQNLFHPLLPALRTACCSSKLGARIFLAQCAFELFIGFADIKGADPRAVAPTNNRPRGESTIVYSMRMPAPPLR